MNEKDRAVVGDMGNAGEGMPEMTLSSMIERSEGQLDETFCQWDKERTDPHHPKNTGGTVQIDRWDTSKKKTIVYFPRGGYICYAYDKTYNPHLFDDVNTLMIGATRLWSPVGYGVAYGVKK